MGIGCRLRRAETSSQARRDVQWAVTDSVGAAPATLDRVTIGPCVFTDVLVAVLDVDKAEPLLGMNVLGLMDHFDIHNRTLTMDCNQLPPHPVFGFPGYRVQYPSK